MSNLTYVEINLDAVRHNLTAIKDYVGKGVGVVAVVKNDAYGCGLVEISRVLCKHGVTMLGVTSLEEGKELRHAGVRESILLLTPILPEAAEEAIDLDLTQTICNLSHADYLNQVAKKCKRKAVVHVKVDTGMGRLGIMYNEAVDFMKRLLDLDNLAAEGIFTHFSTADGDEDFVRLQLSRFRQIIDQLSEVKISIPWRHTANSAALIRFPQSHFNLVRPGLALYGVYPSPGLTERISLKPCISLKSNIVFTKKVPAGWDISYGRTFNAPAETFTAVLPIGYAHGYTRILSHRVEVLIRGKRVPVIGTICMDKCIVDLRSMANVNEGEKVVIIGEQKGERITVEEIAEKAGTIPHEILCLTGRNHHIYI